MIRKMFRERQLLAPEVTEEVLLRNNVGTLCIMGDDDFPYGVPMNYAYKDEDLLPLCTPRLQDRLPGSGSGHWRSKVQFHSYRL